MFKITVKYSPSDIEAANISESLFTESFDPNLEKAYKITLPTFWHGALFYLSIRHTYPASKLPLF